MTSFMHDIETNNGKVNAEDETKEDGNQWDGGKEDDGYINAGRHQHEYSALKI